MATSADHEELYASLRADLLARHFAISRHYRANYLSLWNWLGEEPTEQSHPELSEDERKELWRWNVVQHGRENPLLFSARLLAALAAEHELGNVGARQIIDLALDSFDALYKFAPGDFEGYPIRWDPVVPTILEHADGPPAIAEEFLVGADGEYVYCTPATDPRHVALRTSETLEAVATPPQVQSYPTLRNAYFDRHLRCEISMDELVGLVPSYAIVHLLVDDAGTRARVEAQASKLGAYLADHGYLLVRPGGGLACRGASGILPALELAMASALERITGADHAARTDFRGAMEQAGYWRNVSSPIGEYQALVVAGVPLLPAILGSVAGLAAAVGLPVAAAGATVGEIVEALIGAVGPGPVGAAIALVIHADCFDVHDAPTAGEVAIAELLMSMSPRQRLRAWMTAVELFGDRDRQNASGFPPFLALSALDGGDPTVAETYLSLIATWRASPPAHRPATEVATSPFASAVAVLLGAGAAEEATLRDLLDALHDKLTVDGGKVPFERVGTRMRTSVDDTLHYLAGLALAWLHESRRRGAGDPVRTPGFPTAPAAFDDWPRPTVPRWVVEQLPDVCGAVFGTSEPPSGTEQAFDLFAEVDVARSSVPSPSLPAVPTALVFDRTIVVRERDRDVFTGISLRHGDDYRIRASGEIHGFALAGSSGPEGWNADQLVDDARWPLHTGLDPEARKFALLGYLGGYFEIGTGVPRTRFLQPLVPRAPGDDPSITEWPLYLRINDDRRGDGSGEFNVRVEVWGEPRPALTPGRVIGCVVKKTVIEEGRRRRRIIGVGGEHDDGGRWYLLVEEAVTWIEDYGHEFVVGTADQVPVEVRRTAEGRAYLRTLNDSTRRDNLNHLLACPEPFD